MLNNLLVKLTGQENKLSAMVRQLSIKWNSLKIFVASNVDKSGIYSFGTNEINLMVQEISYFIQKETRRATSHFTAFHKAAKSALMELKSWYTKHSTRVILLLSCSWLSSCTSRGSGTIHGTSNFWTSMPLCDRFDMDIIWYWKYT